MTLDRFNHAFEKTMKHEGGYSNDKNDPGGETFKGISRRAHPDWSGWEYVDKQDFGVALDVCVKDLYMRNYWNPLRCDSFPVLELTDELFDCGVNLGVRKTGMILQRALNALNRGAGLWPDMLVDGRVGPVTVHATRECLRTTPVMLLVKLIKAQRAYHYLEIMEANPKLERFARGWLKRV